MTSVIATESAVFGSCVGEVNVSVGIENRGVALLWVELFGIIFGGEGGSLSAVEVGDGARYWKVCLML